MSISSTHIAHAIVRLYPRRWRARYESEVFALLEDTGTSWTAVIDLGLGAAREWARLAMWFRQPADMTSRQITVASLLSSVATLAACAGCIAIAVNLAPWAAQFPRAAGWLFLIAFPLKAFFLARIFVVFVVGVARIQFAQAKPRLAERWALSGWSYALCFAVFFLSALDDRVQHLHAYAPELAGFWFSPYAGMFQYFMLPSATSSALARDRRKRDLQEEERKNRPRPQPPSLGLVS